MVVFVTPGQIVRVALGDPQIAMVVAGSLVQVDRMTIPVVRATGCVAVCLLVEYPTRESARLRQVPSYRKRHPDEH
jgi:hypothetical protein